MLSVPSLWMDIIYATVGFIVGFLISAICSCAFAKCINGKSVRQMIFSTILKYEARKYKNQKYYSGLPVKPETRPSSTLIAFYELMKGNIAEPNDNMTKNELITGYQERRQSWKQLTDIQQIPSFMNDDECIKKMTISNNVNDNNNNFELNGYLLKYPGTSIENGLIYYCHGGGFHCGDAMVGYPMLCVMMQYLNCYAFGIDYQLCPESGGIPTIIHQCIEGYKYILNALEVHPKKIFITGDSAGGTIVLLLIQKLNQLSLPQPCCAIVLSGITDLTWKTALETERNEKIKDLHSPTEQRKLYELICIEEEDRKEYDEDYDSILSLGKYSPINGDWNGLCPLYVSSSINEVLINDNKMMIDKCNSFGIDIEYEWSQYLPHCTALWCDLIPEARDSLILIISWISNKRKMYSADLKLYHEKQEWEMCLLHALNALLQNKQFTVKSMNEICKELAPNKLINPHKSILKTGNYDANVLMMALSKIGVDVEWFDRRKANEFDLNNEIFLEYLEPDNKKLVGFILNNPEKKMFKIFSRRHWITIKQINHNWYNLDSKLKEPKKYENAQELTEFLVHSLNNNNAELMICRKESEYTVTNKI